MSRAVDGTRLQAGSFEVMTRTNLYVGAARLALTVGLAALPLVGCSPSSQSPAASSSASALALPLVASGAPVAPAPAAEALPPAPPVPVGHLADRRQYYAFADQAYAMNNAFGDAPPDYGFDYGDTQPWVWRSDNGAMRVAEPLPGGGDRYYYYEPGSDYPYLVRDPSYAYGFDDGQLVVIYDSEGHVAPESDYESRRDYASRFFARGRELFANAQQQQHQPVAEPNWVARRQYYADESQAWANHQSQDSDWRAYHDAHQQQYQDQWDGERARRENEAAQFAQSINDLQTAQRDMQAAQRAQAQAQAAQQRASQQPYPPQAGQGQGFHFGGPAGSPPSSPPAAYQQQPGFNSQPQPQPQPQPQGPPDHGGQPWAGQHHDHHPGAMNPGAGPQAPAAQTAPPQTHAPAPGGQGFQHEHSSESWNTSRSVQTAPTGPVRHEPAAPVAATPHPTAAPAAETHPTPAAAPAAHPAANQDHHANPFNNPALNGGAHGERREPPKHEPGDQKTAP